jgi:3-deoxy-D-manno-octulosonic-acid transferase
MSERLPLPLMLYRFATRLAVPFLPLWLHLRRLKGKEEGARLDERRGWPRLARPSSALAWLHGASVGETLTLLPLVERLTQRGFAVLVTSGTRTSADLLARRLPPGAAHHYVPLDVPRYNKRFLDHWRPDLALIAESEIWPNMILDLHSRNIPSIVINGRLSPRSFQRWLKAPKTARAILKRLSLCIAQSGKDGERFSQLGAQQVSVAGNLKFDVGPPPADPLLLAELSGLLAGRPVWVAASTHPGEEELLMAVHVALRPRYPDLLTIIAPRHPERGANLAAIAKRMELKTALRSDQGPPEREIELYMANTIGELGLWFRLAPLVFMGGSLVPHGGQNPIEPVKLGCGVIHGPHVHNFTDIYAALNRSGGALPVESAQDLADKLAVLLADAGYVRAMARAGSETVESLSGALERSLHSIEPFIAQMKLEAR